MNSIGIGDLKEAIHKRMNPDKQEPITNIPFDRQQFPDYCAGKTYEIEKEDAERIIKIQTHYSWNNRFLNDEMGVPVYFFFEGTQLIKGIRYYTFEQLKAILK